MKQNKYSNMKKHASSGDWDITGAWILDATQYVSSPSSLGIRDVVTALLKTTTVPIASLKEGRIVTYIRTAYGGSQRILFRYQDGSNYYLVWMIWVVGSGAQRFVIRKVVSGVETTIRDETTGNYSLNTWIKLRVTWWNDYVGLVIRFEYWNGSIWVEVCADGYDAANLWKDIGGRVGVSANSNPAATQTWFDDTEIYGIG